jgi:hypothetical protein
MRESLGTHWARILGDARSWYHCGTLEGGDLLDPGACGNLIWLYATAPVGAVAESTMVFTLVAAVSLGSMSCKISMAHAVTSQRRRSMRELHHGHAW